MKCPFCGLEMQKGYVRSPRKIYFTTINYMLGGGPVENNNDIVLSRSNFTAPKCPAYHCTRCKKVVIEYAKE